MLQKIGRFRRSRTALLWIGTLVVLLVVAAVAYSAGQPSPSSSGRSGAGSSMSSAPAPALDSGSAEMSAPEKAGVAPDRPSGGGSPTQTDPVTGDRALVRSVQLAIETPDANAVAAKVRLAVAAAGGFISQEQTWMRGSSIVVRVPVDALDRLVADVSGYGTVTSQRSQIADATDQVVDLDARVASQQASVDRVRALLARAESIGDIVSIEGELAQREAELDALKNRLAALRGKAALSTLTLEITRPGDEPIVTDDDDGFLGGLAAGWAGLRELGRSAGAVVGYLIPFLPVLALLLGAAWLVRRRVRATASGRSGPGTEGDS